MTPDERGWRSMDTAPRDGTVVEVWFADLAHSRRVAWADGRWRVGRGSGYPLVEPDGWRPLGGTP